MSQKGGVDQTSSYRINDLDAISVAVSPDGTYVYTADANNGNDVISINAQTGAITRYTISRDGYINPYTVALSPNGTTLYVTYFNRNTVGVFAAENIGAGATQTITLGSNFSFPLGLSVAPDGTKLYVTSNHYSNAAVVDLQSTPSPTTTVTDTLGGLSYATANFVG